MKILDEITKRDSKLEEKKDSYVSIPISTNSFKPISRFIALPKLSMPESKDDKINQHKYNFTL